MRVQEQPKSPEQTMLQQLNESGGTCISASKKRESSGSQGCGSGIEGPSVTLVACSVCKKELHAPANSVIFTCPGCETVLTHSGESFDAAVEHLKRLQQEKIRKDEEYKQTKSTFSLRPASFASAKFGTGMIASITAAAGSGRSSISTDDSMEEDEERTV